jgi:hypothetical protein
VERVRSHNDVNHGFNAAPEPYEDLWSRPG